MRLFMGIPAPRDQALDRCYDSLRSLGKGVKAVKPVNMHITMKFIGETSLDPRSLLEVIEGSIGQFRPFGTVPETIGAFPDWRRPNSVWIGLSNERLLSDLVSSVETALAEAMGIPKENRPFRAHLTIARIKGPADIVSVRDITERSLADLRDSGYSLPVGEIVLFSSTLTPEGPIYERSGSVALDSKF